MQSKISSFFKPSSSDEHDESASGQKKEHVIVNTFQRRAPKFDGVSFSNEETVIDSQKKPISEDLKLKPQLPEFGRTLSKKRSYVQLYLEFGQSDFLLHTCSTCGFKYARGDESDEKIHISFHKNHTHGIQFKGWRNERVVDMPCVEGGRVVLVLDGDSPAHRNKENGLRRGFRERDHRRAISFINHSPTYTCQQLWINRHNTSISLTIQVAFVENDFVICDNSYSLGLLTEILFVRQVQEAVQMMEFELGEGWIFHMLCQVYLYISSQRVAGCLVVEPIQEAFKVLSCSVDEGTDDKTPKKIRSHSSTLKFGEIILQREVVEKAPPVRSSNAFDENHNGAIVCENEAIPAVCGIRAIWVTPSNRRKGIASQLLDAVRTRFCEGSILEKTQLAFSQPSSAGKALASNYFGTASFLVYKT